MNEFTTTPEDVGVRLDKWLVAKFPDRSRSALQKLVTSGKVKLNGKTVTPHIALKVGQIISVDLPPLAPAVLVPSPNPFIKITVLKETEDYLVLNKPAGIVMYQSISHVAPDTLANGLLAYNPKLAEIGEDAVRPGIVHRLDQDVSGVVVIAKTKTMYDSLKQQFADRTMNKEYVALVHGVMSQSSGTIDFPIARSLSNPSKMAARPKQDTKDARDAITDYATEEQFQHFSLLRINIHTGRTHQIRVHMNAIGHPVVGDLVYRPDSLKTQLNPGRILLHAHRLTFTNLSGEVQTIEAPIPNDFQTYIDKFRGV